MVKNKIELKKYNTFSFHSIINFFLNVPDWFDRIMLRKKRSYNHIHYSFCCCNDNDDNNDNNTDFFTMIMTVPTAFVATTIIKTKRKRNRATMFLSSSSSTSTWNVVVLYYYLLEFVFLFTMIISMVLYVIHDRTTTTTIISISIPILSTRNSFFFVEAFHIRKDHHRHLLFHRSSHYHQQQQQQPIHFFTSPTTTTFATGNHYNHRQHHSHQRKSSNTISRRQSSWNHDPDNNNNNNNNKNNNNNHHQHLCRVQEFNYNSRRSRIQQKKQPCFLSIRSVKDRLTHRLLYMNKRWDDDSLPSSSSSSLSGWLSSDSNSKESDSIDSSRIKNDTHHQQQEQQHEQKRNTRTNTRTTKNDDTHHHHHRNNQHQQQIQQQHQPPQQHQHQQQSSQQHQQQTQQHLQHQQQPELQQQMVLMTRYQYETIKNHRVWIHTIQQCTTLVQLQEQMNFLLQQQQSSSLSSSSTIRTTKNNKININNHRKMNNNNNNNNNNNSHNNHLPTTTTTTMMNPFLTLYIIKQIVHILVSTKTNVQQQQYHYQQHQQQQDQEQQQFVVLLSLLQTMIQSSSSLFHFSSSSPVTTTTTTTSTITPSSSSSSSNTNRMNHQNHHNQNMIQYVVTNYDRSDAFVTLSLLCHTITKLGGIEMYKNHHNSSSGTTTTTTTNIIQDVLYDLLDHLWQSMEYQLYDREMEDNHHYNHNNINIIQQLSVKRLSSCLFGYRTILMMSSFREKKNHQETSSGSRRNRLFYDTICRRLIDPDSIGRFTIQDIMLLFRSCRTTTSTTSRNDSGGDDHPNNNNLHIPSAVSTLPPSPSSLVFLLLPETLLFAMIRRCRKKVLLQTASNRILLDLLYSIRIIWTQYCDDTTSSGGGVDVGVSSELKKEIQTFVYTISKFLLVRYHHHKYHHENKDEFLDDPFISSSSSTIINVKNDENLTLSLHDVTKIVSTLQIVNVTLSSSNDPLLHEICYATNAITSGQQTNSDLTNSLVLDCQSQIHSIAQLLRAFYQWNHYQFDDTNDNGLSYDTRDNDSIDVLSNLYRNIGMVFEKSIEQLLSFHDDTDETMITTTKIIEPKWITSILRSVILFASIHQDDNVKYRTIMTPYWNAIVSLFNISDGSRMIHQDSRFLRTCQLDDIIHFVWFIGRTNMHLDWDSWEHTLFTKQRQQLLDTLATHVLKIHDIHPCTPQIVSRILHSFTRAYHNTDQEQQLQDENYNEQSSSSLLLYDLFDQLGEYLLTIHHLSPGVTSTLLYTYAKAAYIRDMGIFDHLMKQMTQQYMIPPNSSIITNHDEKNTIIIKCGCTTRQVAQTLWACGRMITLEYPVSHYYEDMDDNHYHNTAGVNPTKPNHREEIPPYLENSGHCLTFLSKHINDLTTKDLTQTLWAVSRIQSYLSNIVTNLDESVSFIPYFDDTILTKLFERVRSLSLHFTMNEIVCMMGIIHLMMKIHHDPEQEENEVILKQYHKTMFVLTRPFAVTVPIPGDKKHISMELPSNYHIANILRIMGRMNIRDEPVFNNLSQLFLTQMDSLSPVSTTTSVKAVTDILLAHRLVHLTPPQRILDQWAIQKLGLKTVGGQNNIQRRNINQQKDQGGIRTMTFTTSKTFTTHFDDYEDDNDDDNITTNDDMYYDMYDEVYGTEEAYPFDLNFEE